MSIRKRGGRAYQVRIAGFPAQTAPTKEAAEKIELDLKRRRALGDLYEAPPQTVGEAIDGTLSRIAATRGVGDRTREFNEHSAKFWVPVRSVRLPMLKRARVEDMVLARAMAHPRSAKNELEFLKRVLHEAKGRGQRVDAAIFEIPPIRHRARKGRGLTVLELHELASWFPEHCSRLVLLAGQIGSRQNVWFNLTEDMVDLKAEAMTIPAALAKRGREHRIYLTALEVSLFREQLVARAPGDQAGLPDSRGREVESSSLPRSRLGAVGASRGEERSEPRRRWRIGVRRVRVPHAPSHGGFTNGARGHGSRGRGREARAQ